MDSDPTSKTAIFDSFDIAVLMRCGIEVAAVEVPATEAVTYAFELRRTITTVLGAEVSARQAARNALANQIIDCFPNEYFTYLRELNAKQ